MPDETIRVIVPEGVGKMNRKKLVQRLYAIGAVVLILAFGAGIGVSAAFTSPDDVGTRWVGWALIIGSPTVGIAALFYAMIAPPPPCGCSRCDL